MKVLIVLIKLDRQQPLAYRFVSVGEKNKIYKFGLQTFLMCTMSDQGCEAPLAADCCCFGSRQV